MLARIQKLIALGLLGLAAIAFVIGYRLKLPWLGVGFIAMVIAGYALALAIEFVWMRTSYAPDDPARPRVPQLLRAWASEVVTGPQVFLWRQPFRSRREADHLPANAAGRRGLLLIHGYFCNRGLWNPWLRKLRRAGVSYIAINLEPVTASIEAYSQLIDAAVRRLEHATGIAPVIVAHSMGGLAARAWIGAHPDGPMHRLITVATPHSGTRLGGRGRGANVGQMQIGSDWLARLAAGEPPEVRSRFVCFWGHCDNIVFPTRNATLAGADNRHLAATPHVRMVYHPAVFAAAMSEISA